MDKKTWILQCAIDQFAKKGYHHTTMQDIADAAGIAKGGIYFYFKSKEDLVKSIFLHNHDRLFNNLSEKAQRYALNPKEGLIEQIIANFEDLSIRKSLFTIFWRSQADIKEIKQLSINMRSKILIWFREQIIRVYGPFIEPYAFDLSAILISIMREYAGFILFHETDVSIRKLSEFIVAQMDHLAEGLMRSKEQPILSTSLVKSIFPDAEISEGLELVQRLYTSVNRLQQRINNIPLSPEQQRIVRHALHVLKEEAGLAKPRRIILEGMLSLVEKTIGEQRWEELTSIHDLILEFPEINKI